jgi:hypothetical protein
MDPLTLIPISVGVVGLALGVRGEVRAWRADRRLSRADRVTPWTQAVHHSGDLFLITNSSTRDVLVENVTAHQPEKAELIRHRVEYPFRVNAGDSLDFLVGARYMLSTPDVVITWRFVDDKKRERSSRRILPPVEPEMAN